MWGHFSFKPWQISINCPSFSFLNGCQHPLDCFFNYCSFEEGICQYFVLVKSPLPRPPALGHFTALSKINSHFCGSDYGHSKLTAQCGCHMTWLPMEQNMFCVSAPTFNSWLLFIFLIFQPHVRGVSSYRFNNKGTLLAASFLCLNTQLSCQWWLLLFLLLLNKIGSPEGSILILNWS